MMMCPRPIDVGRHVPCGQCMACRINRRRKWTTRLYLEAATMSATSFVTLTYGPEHLPHDEWGDPVVSKRDVQLWLKRLRKRLGAIRYFAVGEYGSRTWRPHYHAMLFGQMATPLLETIVYETWGLGHVSVSEANEARMAYLAGYTVKKMTHADDERLEARPPEFALQSRKPGLGYMAARELGQQYAGAKWLAEEVARTGDVPRTIRFRGKLWPLDNYLLNQIRDTVGVPRLARERIDGTQTQPDYWPYEDIQAAHRRLDKTERRAAARTYAL